MTASPLRPSHVARTREAGTIPSLVPEGALAAVSADPGYVGDIAGRSAVRLSLGDAPQSLGIAVPKSTFIVNKTIASKLGITVPSEVLAQANRVYGTGTEMSCSAVQTASAAFEGWSRSAR